MKNVIWSALFLMILAGCASAAGDSAPRIVQPGAPGDPSRVRTAEQIAADDRPTYSEADVRFMRGMMGHHQQALDMTALVPDRAAGEPVRLIARRIELSQEDEIRLMERWLERRGEAVPDRGDSHAHAGGTGQMPMYGMLTDAEMARLAAARGAEFDRLFLGFMIRHHEGAVEMVADLLASADGGQESEVFQFASGVVSDQPIEIARMRRVLADM